MTFGEIVCWFLGHEKGEKIFEKSFFSPSADRLVDNVQPYCTRCGLSWPAEVYHRRNIYHRTIPIWVARIRNRWVFRKYKWTKKRQREYAVFIEGQVRNFPEVYYGAEKAVELRREALAKLSSKERRLFTEYNEDGTRVQWIYH
jgi:hypothetical protein